MAINILVVDDSAVMRSMIKKTIMRCGLDIGEVYEASNGKDGLNIIDSHWCDLLFIDVNMPIMDGMVMLEKIRQNTETRDLPVLIISTESNEQRIEIINQYDAGFVHKPFTPEKLKEQVLQLLDFKHVA
jgi:two-component system chemotaxis response regulator CheY